MSRKGNNRNLTQARVVKDDEFYTRLSDIENELSHYTNHFKGQTVYCNCDDPRVSNFVKYFTVNFERLGLKRLIATHYSTLQPDLFDCEGTENPLFMSYDGVEITEQHLRGCGDFRSAECVELLKEAGIVVTNPPFSLFREYVTQLMGYKKLFLIIGHMSAVTYRSVFKYIRDDEIRLGVSPCGMNFERPDGSVKHVYATWFTNLPRRKRNGGLVLCKEYNPAEHPNYDNYDAVEISKTKDIPKDYYGTMGVPISFLERHDSDQFEIVGMGEDCGSGFSGGIWRGGSSSCLVKNVAKFKRLFIRRRRVENG